MFGKDLDKLVGSSYTSAYLNDGHLRGLHPSLSAPAGITFGLRTRLRNAVRLLRKPDVLEHAAAPSGLLEEPALLGPLSREDDGPFGRGILLSNLGGLARVTAVDNGNGDVAASVFASVLNATAVLDVDHGAGGNDGRLFHFLKLSGVYEFYALV